MQNNSSTTLTKFGHMSLNMTIGALLGAFLGYNLDQFFNSVPVFLLLLTLFGTTGGFWGFYRELIKELKKKGE